MLSIEPKSGMILKGIVYAPLAQLEGLGGGDVPLKS
jgi:hypothetical protein